MDGFTAAGVDLERANAARMYDYFLGGAHNFAVDRETAERAIAAFPGIRESARANRTYLGRVVRWCVEQGIDQFLDLGSGVPTVGNVHEVAHAVSPAARVAYVDVEPVAVAHAQAILADLDHPGVTVTRADMRDPDTVLAAPGVAGLIDLTRPLGLLAVAVLHFVEGDVGALLARYRARLAPGSVVAISHVAEDPVDPGIARALRATRDAYRGSATPLVLRSRAQVTAMMAGLDLVPPGVVDYVHWPERRPGEPDIGGYGAVGRVPAP
jgi:trans-aconitate methyltransferase